MIGSECKGLDVHVSNTSGTSGTSPCNGECGDYVLRVISYTTTLLEKGHQKNLETLKAEHQAEMKKLLSKLEEVQAQIAKDQVSQKNEYDRLINQMRDTHNKELVTLSDTLGREIENKKQQLCIAQKDNIALKRKLSNATRSSVAKAKKIFV